MSEVVPCGPYRTQAQRVDRFGASVAVHGDDIALDNNNQDSLAEMESASRHRLIKRFKGQGTLSTTDIVGRILHAQTDHRLPRSIIVKAELEIDADETLGFGCIEVT